MINQELFTEVDNYIHHLFSEEDDILKSILPSLEGSSMQHGCISPNQGKLLQVLMACVNAKQVLELGTLGAYSTIWLARALPQDGKIISIEVDAHHADIARQNIHNANLQDKIELKVGKALDILPQLIDEKRIFDFIFIDADKPPYVEYLELALCLSKPGTLLVFDNVIREGKVLDKHSQDQRVIGVQKFNALLAAKKNLTAIILPSIGQKDYDGMAIAVVNRTEYNR